MTSSPALPTQRVLPGRLNDVYENELKRLGKAAAISKIWTRQPDLWKNDAAHDKVISNRLGWLSVIDVMRKEAAALTQFAAEVSAAGLTNIVLLGMGGSSLAPEVFSLTFPAPAGKHFFVLDSTDPESLADILRAIDLRHTLFVPASKSGKTIETLSQFAFFHEQLVKAGAKNPGEHFVAITDAGSHLDTLASQNNFRRTFRNPDDIGGRYSALSYFGLVPAALWGVDVAAVLDSAIAMRAACGPDAAAPTSNSAMQLGALLGAAAQAGDDKLILITSPRLTPLGNWIEQLIAESTGKEGKGIVPVAGGVAPPVGVLADGCVTVALTLEGDDRSAVSATMQELERRNAPVAEIHLSAATQLGAEFFLWETATAIAGASLGIDPFDEPNVQESKDNTSRILAGFESSGEMPKGSPIISDDGIELYTLGEPIKERPLSAALSSFFAERRPDDYLALLAYVDRNTANGAELDAMRRILDDGLGIPVLLGYGPRYMHSIGQLYKGGPASGMFLVITSEKSKDLSIPGAKFTFAQLQLAQALGDLQSLADRSKPALRLHLAQGALAGLGMLRKLIQQALASAGASPRAAARS